MFPDATIVRNLYKGGKCDVSKILKRDANQFYLERGGLAH